MRFSFSRDRTWRKMEILPKKFKKYEFTRKTGNILNIILAILEKTTFYGKNGKNPREDWWKKKKM